MNALILAGALTMGQPNSQVMPDKDATRYIAKAIYKSYGLDKTVSEWEKKHLKLDEYPTLAYIGVIGRAVIERRVTYTWRF